MASGMILNKWAGLALLLGSQLAVYSVVHTTAFTFVTAPRRRQHAGRAIGVAEVTPASIEQQSFIDTELRGAAMRLHTRQQAPSKEGKAPAPAVQKPYTPTHEDYLHFLVDSKHVYEAFEEEILLRDEFLLFRDTGLERVSALERDIQCMVDTYKLSRPPPGQPGMTYASQLRQMESFPALLCHYYNWYFAHTAGGRMIGKQMSALLLDNKTLDFYKWEGDLNKIKARVKQLIEDVAAQWTEVEKKECVEATAGAFLGGGGVNSYISSHRKQ